MIEFLHLISNELMDSISTPNDLDGAIVVNLWVVYLVKLHNHLVSSNPT